MKLLWMLCLLPSVGFAQVLADPTSALDNPVGLARVLYSAVVGGDWVLAAAAAAVLVIAVLRLWGQKLHALLPDDNVLDKPLWFLLETKPGGVMLNALFVSGGGLGLALMSGHRPSWELLKPILAVSFSASAIWGWVKDLVEWWRAKRAPPAPAPPADGAA